MKNFNCRNKTDDGSVELVITLTLQFEITYVDNRWKEQTGRKLLRGYFMET